MCRPGTPIDVNKKNLYKQEKEYEEMTYSELMEAAQTAMPGKEVRQINKVMKRKYGESFPMCYRYPKLPLVILAVAIAVLVLPLIVKVLIRCLL